MSNWHRSLVQKAHGRDQRYPFFRFAALVLLALLAYALRPNPETPVSPNSVFEARSGRAILSRCLRFFRHCNPVTLSFWNMADATRFVSAGDPNGNKSRFAIGTVSNQTMRLCWRLLVFSPSRRQRLSPSKSGNAGG